MKSTIIKLIPAFIGSIVLIAVIIIAPIRRDDLEETVSAQQSEIEKLKNDIKANETAAEKETVSTDDENNTEETKDEHEEVVKKTTGFDAERVDNDTDIIRQLASLMFTWHNSEQYDDIRDKLINEYKVNESSYLLSTLFPPQSELEIFEPVYDDGMSYVDRHKMNAEYEDINVRVSNINADIYSYIVFVHWTSTGKNGGEGDAYTALTLDMNSNGDISNLDGSNIYSDTTLHNID